MWPFRKREKREENTEVVTPSVDDVLLQALLHPDTITKEVAMNIPGVAACVNRIAGTVSQLDVKLYHHEGDEIVEVDDVRPKLLNGDSGDTLTGCEIKRNMVLDMLLDKGGYCYIDKIGTRYRSLRYVEPIYVSFMGNSDPIFKDYQIVVDGHRYEGWNFIRLLHNSRNGFYGRSVISESSGLLKIVHEAEKYQGRLYATGGGKKGFLQSDAHLDQKSINVIKDGFKKMYSDNSENVVVLNDGMKFQEASNTAVESQLDDSTKTINDFICEIFGVPPSIIKGGSNSYDRKLYNEGCILPILKNFAEALNVSLLTEDEKGVYFFEFDTKDLLKADMKERYDAYSVASKAGFMQLDEIRKEENLPALGLDFVKLNLSDVLYYAKDGKVYTPNTGLMGDINQQQPPQEGENPNENTDQGRQGNP